jgi:hypothetical protein
MSYFTYFPTIVVDFSERGDTPKKYLVSDIITNVRAKVELLSNLVTYESYVIQDGETPEMISELYYGSPMYHWVIMLVNDKYDYLNDFPMTQVSLEAFVASKYEDPDAIHHYETADGFVVNSDYINPLGDPDAQPVTNYEYEEAVNESKRTIKLIPPQLLGEVLSQFREILK